MLFGLIKEGSVDAQRKIHSLNATISLLCLNHLRKQIVLKDRNANKKQDSVCAVFCTQYRFITVTEHDTD